MCSRVIGENRARRALDPSNLSPRISSLLLWGIIEDNEVKITSMGTLIRTIAAIALLRRGPQTLPASSFLLYLLLAAHWGTGVLLGLFSLSPAMALLAALAGTLIMVALVHGLLLMHWLHSRVTQTLSALAGCEVLIGLLGVPLTALFYAGGGMAELAVLLSLLLLVWNLAVAAHIFRHALSVSMGIGVLFAIGYILISMSLSGLIGPAG